MKFLIGKLFLAGIVFSNSLSYSSTKDDREITDANYKFTFVLPDAWSMTAKIETEAKDGVDYSFKKDSTCSIMLLSFKVEKVKNLEDFIYTMEMDGSLNIPKRSGDYTSFEFDAFDGKWARYKDAQYTEIIYFYRTRLPNALSNYVHMLRFISENRFLNAILEFEIKKISDSFLPTVK